MIGQRLGHYHIVEKIGAGGQRFLMIRSEQEAGPTQMNIVLNWFEELRRIAAGNE